MLKRRLGLIAAGAVFLVAGTAPAVAEVAVPPLRARVTDLTATLDSQQIQTLETQLRDFERAKGSQIAVLILPSTNPETIEQYSIRVAEAWKVGRARIDDGAILVVAKDDRRLRIEVGRGLEGAIPDAVAKRVVSDVIAPRFKANDFYGGISAGTGALIQLIEGESLPVPRTQGQPQSGGENIFILLFSAVLGVIIFLRYVFRPAMSGRGGRRRRTGWSSGDWFSGGWSSGGSSSGGWSGGGGDSGSFSGGGGDFGGGGASGSW